MRSAPSDRFFEIYVKGLSRFHVLYDCIVAAGLAANPLPEKKPGKRGKPKKGKIRCLLERFQDCKADILRFATDWRVPYTNNDAEQAIRFARVKEKVSGCFRTEEGAEGFARLLSFISTAVRHGISSFLLKGRVFHCRKLFQKNLPQLFKTASELNV